MFFIRNFIIIFLSLINFFLFQNCDVFQPKNEEKIINSTIQEPLLGLWKADGCSILTPEAHKDTITITRKEEVEFHKLPNGQLVSTTTYYLFESTNLYAYCSSNSEKKIKIRYSSYPVIFEGFDNKLIGKIDLKLSQKSKAIFLTPLTEAEVIYLNQNNYFNISDWKLNEEREVQSTEDSQADFYTTIMISSDLKTVYYAGFSAEYNGLSPEKRANDLSLEFPYTLRK